MRWPGEMNRARSAIHETACPPFAASLTVALSEQQRLPDLSRSRGQNNGDGEYDAQDNDQFHCELHGPLSIII